MSDSKKVKLDFGALSPFEFKVAYQDMGGEMEANKLDSHVHPECEIYINLTGNVSFMVENKIYPIVPGSIIITRPYEYHQCLFHSDAWHKHFWILFSAAGNEHLFPQFFSRKKGENNLLMLPVDKREELIALCHGIVAGTQSEADKYSSFFRLIRLLELALVDDKSDCDSIAPDVVGALSYIDENFDSPITVKELADSVHVSVNTLERHFKDTIHCSPSEYIKRKRLARAASLLHRGATVMQACNESGFSDYSGFITLFKKNYGITPLKYRNEHKKTDER